IEAGQLELEVERFSLPEVLESALTMVRERASNHGIGLRLTLAPGVETIEADERKVKQILFNLLSNAVKFTPEGGSITVRARAASGWVRIAIVDSGIGIPKDALAKLGRPFEQVESQLTKSHQGSGLGLAIARSLTELHGGTMRIRSTPGKGTIVQLRLPVDGSAPQNRDVEETALDATDALPLTPAAQRSAR
ncbi:MAG: sensor histidine kinase, partial [Xanthobacteraceae bacterium]